MMVYWIGGPWKLCPSPISKISPTGGAGRWAPRCFTKGLCFGILSFWVFLGSLGAHLPRENRGQNHWLKWTRKPFSIDLEALFLSRHNVRWISTPYGDSGDVAFKQWWPVGGGIGWLQMEKTPANQGNRETSFANYSCYWKSYFNKLHRHSMISKSRWVSHKKWCIHMHPIYLAKL